jgi:hypothetical protein
MVSTLTLSLLVFTVGLAVYIDSTFSSHHVTVFAKLLDGSSHFESSVGNQKTGK